ncbi:MAG: hypothetical protein AAF404_09245, partial [Pseudomonadota bacterium]
GQVMHPMIAQAAGFPAVFHIASIYGLFAAASVWWFYRSPSADQLNAAGGGTTGLSSYHLKQTLIESLVWSLINAD